MSVIHVGGVFVFIYVRTVSILILKTAYALKTLYVFLPKFVDIRDKFTIYFKRHIFQSRKPHKDCFYCCNVVKITFSLTENGIRSKSCVYIFLLI